MFSREPPLQVEDSGRGQLVAGTAFRNPQRMVRGDGIEPPTDWV